MIFEIRADVSWPGQDWRDVQIEVEPSEWAGGFNPIQELYQSLGVTLGTPVSFLDVMVREKMSGRLVYAVLNPWNGSKRLQEWMDFNEIVTWCEE